jgi:hypothetical protein
VRGTAPPEVVAPILESVPDVKKDSPVATTPSLPRSRPRQSAVNQVMEQIARDFMVAHEDKKITRKAAIQLCVKDASKPTWQQSEHAWNVLPGGLKRGRGKWKASPPQ